jgi:hypothetical protein
VDGPGLGATTHNLEVVGSNRTPLPRLLCQSPCQSNPAGQGRTVGDRGLGSTPAPGVEGIPADGLGLESATHKPTFGLLALRESLIRATNRGRSFVRDTMSNAVSRGWHRTQGD